MCFFHHSNSTTLQALNPPGSDKVRGSSPATFRARKALSAILKRNGAILDATAASSRHQHLPNRLYTSVVSRAHLYKPPSPQSLSKGSSAPSFQFMSATASVSAGFKEGLRLLVTGGPAAHKWVGVWLFGSAALVFSMVVLGGVTRLTRSGLLMTDWKFTGSLPPLTDEEWLVEFVKYKHSPEYKW